ncbi:hypothetical protein M378DRAFT_12811 [Amanita muscaria Koide BX008]|uniref:Uncharacterized protein n=1 Tax=Amanita muscaria (strain Koide BX008) TaxID=946122 RepID=A0A0C2WLL9_AMAMK|nr:hypothetical protein M378DRAFT_12811 [Amanita muscaria Koide BX008]
MKRPEQKADSYNGIHTDTGVGIANPQLDKVRRKTLDLVNRLHSTGVQVDVDLPQIAVIGSQSAGKSSLIESISGITLPRAAGTCTRCPTECRLSYSKKPWQCIVSLRFTTDAKGQPLGQAHNESFGSTIFDKREVEQRIRRAQRAILNPSKPRKDFLLGDDKDLSDHELSFSINCVSLQISGSDVADLSFCDLPGLIASVGVGGNTNDIALVESLVVSYIKKPSCIILLTVACETDFENQGAHRLAKQYDPQGKRTIGVLTKPDRIPTGEENRWIAFITNMKEPLENGWYCVKQPGSNDIQKGITWREARKSEEEFFAMTLPWSELDGTYQRFLRTSNLVERLSTVLSDLISKRLPEIRDELERSIAKAVMQLKELPKEPSNDPLAEIMNLLHLFVIDISKHAEGIPAHDGRLGLLQIIREAQLKFRHAIKSTTPEFMPFYKKSGKFVSTPKFLSIDEEEVDSMDKKTGKSLSTTKLFATEEGEVGSMNKNAGKTFRAPMSFSGEEGKVDVTEKRSNGQFVYYLDEIMDKAHQARTRELPGNYPYVVQEECIKSLITHWRNPALLLCQSVYQLILDHVKELVPLHFSSFGQGFLEQRVRILMQDHVKGCWERTEERIEWLLEMEKRPATLNTHYLADYRDKFFAFYKGARAIDLNPNLHNSINSHSQQTSDAPSIDSGGSAPKVQGDSGVAKVLHGLLELGITNVNPEDIPKLLPSDPMEPALEIMAEVRAYFQVAFKRFVDNVPNAIDGALVRGITKDLLQTLYVGLGIHGKDGHQICRDLAKDYSAVAYKREELKKKLERLNVAMQELLLM